MKSIERLPSRVQDDIAKTLSTYSEQWRALKDGIAEARNDIDAGRVTEISSVEDFVDNLKSEHGHS